MSIARHGRMMDVDRLADRSASRLEGDDRAAAVLVPLIRRLEGDHLLFTKRSHRVSDHPGQMSFPGGGREPADIDAFATATREAEEEIGLSPTQVEPIGQLDDIRTVSEYVVTPFVATIPDRQYEPDGREVAEVAILPVESFLDPDNYECTWRSPPGETGRWVHYFRIEGYTVWGATGRLVVQLLELTTDWNRGGARP